MRATVFSRPSVLAVRAARSNVKVQAQTHTVVLRFPEGKDRTIQCDANTTILEAAEANGIQLEHMCRSTLCTNCSAKVLSGKVHQEQNVLPLDKSKEGYALMCSSYPTSDLVILVNQLEVVYQQYPQKSTSGISL